MVASSPRAVLVAGDPLPPKWCKQFRIRRHPPVHQSKGAKGTHSQELTLERAKARARVVETVALVVEEVPVAVPKGMAKETAKEKAKVAPWNAQFVGECTGHPWPKGQGLSLTITIIEVASYPERFGSRS